MSNLKYNFDNGYNNLSKISAPVKILDYNFSEALSSYANFTPIYAVPDFTNSDPTIRDSNYFFDFGDGTKSDAFTASHVYKEPGEYKVTLIVTDSNDNIFRSSDEKIIKVKNLIPDSIYLKYLHPTNVEQFYSSLSVDPIYVTRFNSISLSQLLSSDGFKVDLSIQDNRVPLVTEEIYNKDKNFHLKGNCFFANTRGKKFKVIDSVQTTSVNIFAGISGSEIILSPDKPNDIANTFVGTSGLGTFYYYEDILEFDEESNVNSIFIESPTIPAPETPSPETPSPETPETPSPETPTIPSPETPETLVTVLVDSDEDFVVDGEGNIIEIDE